MGGLFGIRTVHKPMTENHCNCSYSHPSKSLFLSSLMVSPEWSVINSCCHFKTYKWIESIPIFIKIVVY